MQIPPPWFRRLYWITASLLLLLTLFSVSGIRFLEFDDDLRNLFFSDSPEQADFDRLVSDFGSNDGQCILWLSAPNLLSKDRLQRIQAIENALLTSPAIEKKSVVAISSLLRPQRSGRLFFAAFPTSDDDSVGAWKETAKILREHPFGPGRLISPDLNQTLVRFQFSDALTAPEFDRDKISDELQRLQAMVNKIWSSEGGQFGITGLPVIRLEVTRVLQRDQGKFTILGLIFATIVGGLMFRRPVPMLIVALVPFTGLGCTMGLLGWLNIPLNIMSNVVTPLVLVIGFAEAVHLLFVAGEMIDRGKPRWQASLLTVQQLMVPCALAAATTVIGFGSLAVAKDPALKVFAQVAASASILMFLVTLGGTGCLLASPLGKFCGRHSRGNGAALDSKPLELHLTYRYRKVLVGGSLILVTGLGVIAFKNHADYRYSENLPASNDAAATLRKIDEGFTGSSPASIVIQFGKNQGSAELIAVLKTATARIHQIDGVSQTSSLLNLLESMPPNQALDPNASNFKDADQTHRLREIRYLPKEIRDGFLIGSPLRTQIRLQLPDWGSHRLKPVLDQIEMELDAIRRQFPDVELYLAGMSVLSISRSERMIGDLVRSLLCASLVIFGLILAVYRRWQWGVAAIVVNAFPLLGVAAVMTLNGHPVQYTSVMLLCTCLGLAVDDTVHFLSKLRVFEKQGIATPAAIAKVVRKMRPVFITTSAMLGVGFGLAATSDIPTFQTFGGYASLALLLALIGDLVFLPAWLWQLGGNDQRKILAK